MMLITQGYFEYLGLLFTSLKYTNTLMAGDFTHQRESPVHRPLLCNSIINANGC
jgi:hypothetical protein